MTNARELSCHLLDLLRREQSALAEFLAGADNLHGIEDGERLRARFSI
jgi:hypothetical protein